MKRFGSSNETIICFVICEKQFVSFVWSYFLTELCSTVWVLPVISLLLTNTISLVRACLIIWWERFRGTQKRRRSWASYYSILSEYSTCLYSQLYVWNLTKLFSLSLPDIEYPPAVVDAVAAVVATAVAAFAFDAVAVAPPLVGWLLLVGCCCCRCVSFLPRPLLCWHGSPGRSCSCTRWVCTFKTLDS